LRVLVSILFLLDSHLSAITLLLPAIKDYSPKGWNGPKPSDLPSPLRPNPILANIGPELVVREPPVISRTQRLLPSPSATVRREHDHFAWRPSIRLEEKRTHAKQPCSKVCTSMPKWDEKLGIGVAVQVWRERGAEKK
jgi:hypothetical protein